DFDYWVCVDGRDFTPEDKQLFRRKLRAVEKWAADFARAEVHFFVMDLNRVRRNDFGQTGHESTGSAMGNLLKEEFYRSLTLVAGQIPLWWIMPPGVDGTEYERLARRTQASTLLNPNELVDMGNLEPLSLSEFYGAAIWQISKTIGSPFKSVLKIALLEEYIMNRGAQGLLADELKRRLTAGLKEAEFVDPYLLMFDRATNYLEAEKRRLDLNLLRRCLYLKVGEKVTWAGSVKENLPRKKRIMANLVHEWAWNPAELEFLNNYHNWPFEESQRFSEQINGFIFRAFDKIADELSAQKEPSTPGITRRDLKVLERKLFAFYQTRPHKVDSIKNVIERPPVLSGLTIQRALDDRDEASWLLYRGLLSRDKAAEESSGTLLLKRSAWLAEALVWLVNNRLWGRETTLNLNAGRGELAVHCTVADIQQLLQELKRFFPPYRYREIPEEALLEDPRTARMLLVVNLNEPDRTGDLVEVCVCYQNNWGELFFEGFEDYLAGLKLARSFLSGPGRPAIGNGPPSDFRVFLSARHLRRDILPILSRDLGVPLGD
ncbi:MAG: class I adenylate cyclase, partial [Thermodesulfobacteriota bacterium]